MSERIKVDIWSDIACPWCYIGKRKFESGLSAFAESDSVDVEFHSFELAPETPVDFDGNEVDFLSSHKGIPADQVGAMLDRVTGIAKTVGLDYDFDSLKHTNTVRAHQLIHFAKAQGLQLEMTERLLRAYFVEGRHVGRIAELVELATEVGLDAGDVTRALENDEYLADVRADQQQAQAYGIQGVPFFVIDGKYGVSGAQDPAAFVQVLDTVWSEKNGTAVTENVDA